MFGITGDLDEMLDFTEVIDEYIKKTGEHEANEIILSATKQYVADLNSLSSPMSKVRKGGYTHLIRTFGSRISPRHKDVEVGWGKYYGPIVEKRRPHMRPAYNANAEKYIEAIRKEFDL